MKITPSNYKDYAKICSRHLGVLFSTSWRSVLDIVKQSRRLRQAITKITPSNHEDYAKQSRRLRQDMFSTSWRSVLDIAKQSRRLRQAITKITPSNQINSVNKLIQGIGAIYSLSGDRMISLPVIFGGVIFKKY